MRLIDLAERSKVTTEILEVANMLVDDDLYTKGHAARDLLLILKANHCVVDIAVEEVQEIESKSK